MKKVQLALCSLVFACSNALSSPIDLGAAGDFTLLAAGTPWKSNGGGVNTLGVEAEIFGNVGARNHLALASSVKIHGNAYSETRQAGTNSQINGDIGNLNWDLIYQDMLTASKYASSLTADHVFSNIIDTSVLSAFGSKLSVFNVSGDIKLESNETLTFKGNASDQFIINVAGNFEIGSGAKVLLEGVTAENILFNLTGNGFTHAINVGGSTLSGTYLAPTMHITLGDGATLEQTRFLASGITANVQTVSGITTIPAPASLGLLLLGLLSFAFMRKNQYLGKFSN